MTIDELRLAAKAEPFAPFVLCLADGRELLVRGPYQIGWPEDDHLGLVGYAHSGDNWIMLDLSEITSIRWLPSSAANGDGEVEDAS
jgi:hypothetical protein